MVPAPRSARGLPCAAALSRADAGDRERYERVPDEDRGRVVRIERVVHDLGVSLQGRGAIGRRGEIGRHHVVPRTELRREQVAT